MSKRGQESQGGDDRYGAYGGGAANNNVDASTAMPATQAQMARRKIAAGRRPGGSQRSSRASTPTGNLFSQAAGGLNAPQGQQQPQSTPSFQIPTTSNIDFGFSQQNQDSASAPPSFQFGNNQTPQTNGTSSAAPPPFQFGSTSAPQTNGNGGSMFGNNSFGSTFGQNTNTSQPMQQNGFNPSTTLFGSQDNTANNNAPTTSIGGFSQNTSTQPQQNGLTPSTTSSFPSFGQQNGGNKSSFGQSQQQPSTQSTSGTSFGGFGQPNGAQAPTTTSFGSLGGQSIQQSNGDKSLSLFGATSQPEQTSRPSTSNLSSGFGQQSQNENQQNGASVTMATKISGASQPENSRSLLNRPPTMAKLKPPEAGASVFDNLTKPTIKQGMFTSGIDSTPKPNTSSLFSGPFGQLPQQNGEQTSGDVDQTPTGNSVFSSLAPPNGIKQGMFTTSSTSQSALQTPKPTGGLFSGGFGQNSQQQSNMLPFAPDQSQGDTSMASDRTPEQMRFSSGNAQQASTPTPAASSISAPAETSANVGKSLFDRISKDPTPSSTSAPSTSLPGGPGLAEKSHTPRPPSRGQSARERYQGPLIRRGTEAAAETSTANSTSNVPTPPWVSQPSAKATTTTTNTTTSAPTSPWAPQPPAQVTTTAAPTSVVNVSMGDSISDAEKHTFKYLNEGLMAHLATQDPSSDWTTILEYTLKEAAKIRKKPEPNFEALVEEALAPSLPSAPLAASVPSAPSASRWNAPTSGGSSFVGSSNALQVPEQSLTPNPDAHQAAPTALMSKKRRAVDEEDNEQEDSPAEKRRKADEPPVQYPKLPDNASETAKRFQAALDRPSPGPGKADFPRSLADSLQRKSNEKAAEEREARAEKERRDSEELMEKEREARETEKAKGQAANENEPPASIPAPPDSLRATTARDLGPPVPAALPPPVTLGPPRSGGSFLSAFGKKANEEEEKARRKRKLEDYDSDEENEDAWAERDQEEQKAKRQKILDVAKSAKGFMPSGTNTPTDGVEGEENPSEGAETETEKEKEPETPMGAGGGLFDRISKDPPATAPSKPSIFGSQTPFSKPSTTTGLFGSKTPAPSTDGSSMTSSIFGKWSQTTKNLDNDKSVPEKEQGSGDNTWKLNTPIKFGDGSTTGTESATPAGPPPTVARLFGSNMPKPSMDNMGLLNVPKPASSLHFGFGGQPASLGTSRATTPGVTTDGEGASTAGEGENEPSDEASQNEPQVEDQTGLHPDDYEGEDLLFSADIAKASKIGQKRNDDTNAIVHGWHDKGKGPLYILRRRDDGKVRVLLKVPPYGTPRMNFGPLKGVEYEVKGNTGKIVQGMFMDHLDKRDAGSGKPSTWSVQVREPAQAEEIARLLMEGRPQ